MVIADAEQIKRVINNIISNSLKYMNKPKGAINIRLRDVGDFIQVEIEDNGKGIAQKDLASIFLYLLNRCFNEILRWEEAESDCLLLKRLWKITAVRFGQQVKKAQVRPCIWL